MSAAVNRDVEVPLGSQLTMQKGVRVEGLALLKTCSRGWQFAVVGCFC